MLSFKRSLLNVLLLSGVSALTPISAAASQKAPVPLTEIKTFAEVFEELKHNYVTPLDDKAVIESAIDGMLERLDPHSTYLTPDALDSLNASTEGEFGGLGIEVQLQQGILRIITPIDDTPASRAGIQPGDEVTHIDGQAVKVMTMREIIKAIRGKVGSEIHMVIKRIGTTTPVEVSMTREVIKTKSVTYRQEGNVGYIRISQFQRPTADLLKKAVKSLKHKNINALLLDLRNNPGGLLNAAVDAADLFIEKGKLVSTRGRTVRETQTFNARSGDSFKGLPVYVLINSGSASASEILAGALQDHKRGTILGTRSFGKGSVQTIVPLQNKGALKITTALYYTPNDVSIQANGIMPDIWVEQVNIGKQKDGRGYRESDLAGHLENPNQAENAKSGPERLALEDYQLYQTLNIIRNDKNL